VRRYLKYLYALVFLGLFWQIGSFFINSAVCPDPIAVMERLAADTQTVSYWKHVGVSIFRIVVALMVAFITAVPLGLFLGMIPKYDRLIKPFIYLAYPIPKIVLLPLVLLFFGIGNTGKIAMLTMILFFQLLITARDASRSIGRDAVYSLKSLGGTNRHLFYHVVWPACLPSVFTALRVATGTLVAVLFFIESISTRYGLGYYILDAWGRADTTQIFVGMISLAVLGVFFYEFFDILERTYCRWNHL